MPAPARKDWLRNTFDTLGFYPSQKHLVTHNDSNGRQVEAESLVSGCDFKTSLLQNLNQSHTNDFSYWGGKGVITVI